MNENIIKLENLFEEITNVQQEIKTKTNLRNEYIISHVNPVFEEIQDKINKYIELIDKVFPLDKLSNTIMWNGKMKSRLIHNNQYEIFIHFDFKDKTCNYSYRKNEAAHSRNNFALKVTPKEEWVTKNGKPTAYSLTCQKFINIFGTIDNVYIFLDIFEDIIQDIVTALTNKLKQLKENSSSIVIPQIEDAKRVNEKEKIVLGEFDNYQIILEKKNIERND